MLPHVFQLVMEVRPSFFYSKTINGIFLDLKNWLQLSQYAQYAAHSLESAEAHWLTQMPPVCKTKSVLLTHTHNTWSLYFCTYMFIHLCTCILMHLCTYDLAYNSLLYLCTYALMPTKKQLTDTHKTWSLIPINPHKFSVHHRQNKTISPNLPRIHAGVTPTLLCSFLWEGENTQFWN